MLDTYIILVSNILQIMPKSYLQKHWNFAEMKTISQYHQHSLNIS